MLVAGTCSLQLLHGPSSAMTHTSLPGESSENPLAHIHNRDSGSRSGMPLPRLVYPSSIVQEVFPGDCRDSLARRSIELDALPPRRFPPPPRSCRRPTCSHGHRGAPSGGRSQRESLGGASSRCAKAWSRSALAWPASVRLRRSSTRPLGNATRPWQGLARPRKGATRPWQASVRPRGVRRGPRRPRSGQGRGKGSAPKYYGPSGGSGCCTGKDQTPADSVSGLTSIQYCRRAQAASHEPCWKGGLSWFRLMSVGLMFHVRLMFPLALFC